MVLKCLIRVLLRCFVLFSLFSQLVFSQDLPALVECPNWGDYRHLSEFDIPATQLVQQVFDCSHVSEYITDLDQLDRDLLFLRAAKSDWETLVEYHTQTEPPVPYLELIPESSLRALQRSLRPSTPGPQSQPCD